MDPDTLAHIGYPSTTTSFRTMAIKGLGHLDQQYDGMFVSADFLCFSPFLFQLIVVPITL